MPKIAFTILGALLIVGSAARIASADEGHARADSSNHRGAHNWSKPSFFKIPQTRARSNVDPNIEELRREQDPQGCGWPLCGSANGG